MGTPTASTDSFPHKDTISRPIFHARPVTYTGCSDNAVQYPEGRHGELVSKVFNCLRWIWCPQRDLNPCYCLERAMS